MDDASASVVGTIVVVAFIIGIIAVIWSSLAKSEALEKAKTDYKRSLAKLKADPTNSDLRQKTLDLGRVYSNLTRDSKGVTIFDEIALMNDINTVYGGTTSITGTAQSAPTPAATSTPSLSVEERLAKLSDLKAKGLIDDQEYDTRRKKILDEI